MKVIAIEERWNSAGIATRSTACQAGRATKASPSTRHPHTAERTTIASGNAEALFRLT